MKKIINFFKSAKTQNKEDSCIKKYDIIVHIGAGKTGSSAIQKFLLQNRDVLAKHNFYYPEHELDKNGISGGHSLFGLSLVNNEIEKAEVIFKSYVALAKEKNMTLLLSAESLFNYHGRFHALTKGYNCKIISFFREPLEAILSSYNQSVKRHFDTMPLGEVCNKALSTNMMGSGVYGKWTELFGKENMTILEYDLDYFKKHSIQEVFLTHIGLDAKTIQNIKPKEFQQINRSYTLAELEFKRVLNHILDKENNQENYEIDWTLQKLSDEKQETYTLVDQLSSDMYTVLNEKFNQVKTKLLEYGMIILNQEDDVNREYKQNKYLYKNKINDILSIVEYFKKEQPQSYSYMHSRILEHLRHQQNLSCDVLNLAKWFDIDTEVVPNKSEPWFSEAQLKNMATGKYKEADFLRDIATLLLHKRDLHNADKIISKALELRPTGPAIIQLKQTILEQMEQK